MKAQARKRKKQYLFNQLMHPTLEQKQILSAVSKLDRLKIKAFAGSGKTTTLRMIAETFKDKKMIYLAFNRSVAEEAKRKFPKNVRVTTVHSLAYAELLRIRKFKPFKLENSLNTFLINRFFGGLFKGENEVIAEAIKRVFLLFCYSDCSSFREEKFKEYLLEDDELDGLLWEFALEKLKEKSKSDPTAITFDNIKKTKIQVLDFVIDRAKELYEAMVNEEFSWTHDFYLKFFVENYEDRLRKLGYDFILLDEAQDSNPVTLKLFQLFNGRKIMVGDPHQQIYAWRGSINVMNDFEAEELSLSVSFRFPQSIADKLNRVLAIKGEKTEIIGKGTVVDENERVCLIARSNSTLIKRMYDLESFAITRDLKEIFKNALIVEAIKKGRSYIPLLEMNLPLQYRIFLGDYSGFVSSAKRRNDIEMLRAIALVEEFGNISDVFYSASLKCNPLAKIVLSTAHSAKGLEWNTVCLLDDFTDIRKEYEKLVPFFDNYAELKEWVKEKKLDKKRRQFIEEVNLYYVALSRGIREVVDVSANGKMGRSFFNFYTLASIKFF